MMKVPGQIPPLDSDASGLPATARVKPLSGHINVLDGLRGLAIVLVLLSHFTNVDVLRSSSASLASRVAAKVLEAGWSGVDLFFVLSGFLITGILLRTRRDSHYFRTFYIRRTLRVFPLYYAALILCLIILPRLSAPMRDRVTEIGKDQVYLWTYTMNLPWIWRFQFFDYAGLSHFWSLAVEEHFYLIWPAVVLLLRPRTLAWTCISIIIAAALTRLWLWHIHMPAWSIYHFTLARMDALALGALITVVIDRRGVSRQLTTLAKWFGIASFGIILSVAFFSGDFKGDNAAVQLVGLTFVAGFWGCGLVLILPSPKRLSAPARMLEWPISRALGKFSYAMYVLHLLPRDMIVARYNLAEKFALRMHSALAGALTAALLGIVITFLMALISWHLYEKHFLKLKRFFEYSKSQRSLPHVRKDEADVVTVTPAG